MAQEITSVAPGELTLEEALRMALVLHQGGEFADADKLYRRILEAFPEQPEALHFLGLLERQQGRQDEAIRLMRRAIAAAPEYAGAYTNLSNLLQEKGELDAAREYLHRALELAPDDPRALNNLGNLERAGGNLDKAVAAFEAAVAIAPEFALPYENLGRHYYRLGEIPRAHDLFCKAVTYDSSLCHSQQFMGMALTHLGRLDEARAHYQKWMDAEPDNPVPKHMLTTVSDDLGQERASDDYIRTVFDSFASTFEVQLRRLDYRAPQLVVNGLSAAGIKPEAQCIVLDAGCGTGLCGPLLRPFARRLDGVDLSKGMLEKARVSETYDVITQAELTAYMQQQLSKYDIIVCADTLCYFGDLQKVMTAAAGALRGAGTLVFSVEKAEPEQAPAGYRIAYSGRYLHTEAYLAKVVAVAGLQLRALEPHVLRMEAGKPVEGFVVVASAQTGA